jgi:hypothetical protein
VAGSGTKVRERENKEKEDCGVKQKTGEKDRKTEKRHSTVDTKRRETKTAHLN